MNKLGLLNNFISFTLILFQLKEEHLYNMPNTPQFLLKLKFNKLILFKDEHPENIPFILVTLLVLKLDKLILFKDEHP